MSILLEQFEDIVNKTKQDAIMPLLLPLNEKQKKELIPRIKELGNEYYKHQQFRGQWIMKGTDKQREIIQVAAYMCMNRKDFEKIGFPSWILRKNLLYSVVYQYCPPWFSEMVNALSEKVQLPLDFDYDECMKLVYKGMFIPGRQTIWTLLVPYPHEVVDRKRMIRPEKLLVYPETLNEHIWYLLEEESSVAQHWMLSDKDIKEAIKAHPWTFILKKFSDENKIDRKRVLKELLLGTNRNFNKTLSAWHADSFNHLEPTEEELISLQKELFSALSAAHSKSVTNALMHIKKLVTEKEFDAISFLDAAPVLLSSNIKSTVATVLMILEKLAQKHQGHKEKICLIACQVFVHANDELQTKAAKIIVKNADAANETIRQEIATFYPNLMTVAKQLLSGFIIEDSITQQQVIAEETIPIEDATSLTVIQYPANIDDLVFLASQAGENHESWHFDLFLASMVNLRTQLKPHNIAGFEPAFQRAFSLLRIKWVTAGVTASLDWLLSMFMIDVGNWLMDTYPESIKSFEGIFKLFNTPEEGKTINFRVSPQSGSYTAECNYGKHIYYYAHKQLALVALDKIRKGNELPLLSTPTHAPCWIDPAILINRLQAYQQANQVPDEMDLQVAISRCYLQDAEAALQLASLQLSGEIRDLMLFLLNDDPPPTGPFQYPAAWMVSSLSRKTKRTWPQFESLPYYKVLFNSYTGELIWRSDEEEYKHSYYDFEKRKQMTETKLRKFLRVSRDLSRMSTQQSGLKKIFSKVWSRAATNEDAPMLFEYLVYKSDFPGSDNPDIKRIFSLAPTNPEPLLADIINSCLQFSKFGDEGDKRMVIDTLQFLHGTWHNPGQMSYLFLGSCMLGADKTVLNIAGEIWLKAVTMGKIDNVRVGKVIGLQERIEFAPLKRFTDLVTQTLFRVSALHNGQLQVLVENILPELPDEPIKGLKKLLEIYGELLMTNKSSVPAGNTLERLKIWQNNVGLQKTIATLLSYK